MLFSKKDECMANRFRTLARIDYRDDFSVFVCIPAWDSKARIALDVTSLPQEVVGKTHQIYWHIECNLAAENRMELDIDSWSV